MKYNVEEIITLFEFLTHRLGEVKKNTLRSFLRSGRVFVDGSMVKKGNTPLLPGQRVEIEKKSRILEKGIKILYEDHHRVFIDKPQGLLSVATDFHKDQTAHAILKRRFSSHIVYPVHRLDRDVSGVMVFAYSCEARSHFKKLFHDHLVDRQYLALVEGNFTSAKGTWKSCLVEDRDLRVKTAPQGKEAITHYRVLNQSPKETFLEIKLETGRKNQIRVHCQEAGHPIVGDKKYGSKTNR